MKNSFYIFHIFFHGSFSRNFQFHRQDPIGKQESRDYFFDFFSSGGWQKFQEAMTESFGENWENEFRSLTGEDPPGKHFYRDIYEEELEKPAGIWFKMVLSG